MDEPNLMQTVCWQTRPLAISNQARGREETFNGYRCSRSRQNDAILPAGTDDDICQAGHCRWMVQLNTDTEQSTLSSRIIFGWRKFGG